MELSWIKVRKQGTMQGREKETPSQGMEDLFFFFFFFCYFRGDGREGEGDDGISEGLRGTLPSTK